LFSTWVIYIVLVLNEENKITLQNYITLHHEYQNHIKHVDEALVVHLQ